MLRENRTERGTQLKIIRIVAVVAVAAVIAFTIMLIILLLGQMGEQRNSATVLLPIAGLIGLAVGFSVLAVRLWRGKRARSKMVLIGWGVVGFSLVALVISPVINNQVTADTFRSDLDSAKVYATGHVTYDIPSQWYTKKIHGTTYFYPSAKDNRSLGMVMVGDPIYTELGYDDKTRAMAYDAIRDALGLTWEDTVITSEADALVARHPARLLRYTATIDSVKYEAVAYIVIVRDRISVFTFAFPNKSPQYFEEAATKIINSVEAW